MSDVERAPIGEVPGLANISPAKEIVLDPCADAPIPPYVPSTDPSNKGISPNQWRGLFPAISQFLGPVHRRNWAAVPRLMNIINAAGRILDPRGNLDIPRGKIGKLKANHIKADMIGAAADPIPHVYADSVYTNHIYTPTGTLQNVDCGLRFQLSGGQSLSGGSAQATVISFWGPADLNPGANVTVYDPTGLFHRAWDANNGDEAVGICYYNFTTAQFEVGNCNQQGVYGTAVAAQTFDADNATVTTYGVDVQSQKPQSQEPSSPVAVVYNTYKLSGQVDDTMAVQLFGSEWRIITSRPRKIQDVEITDTTITNVTITGTYFHQPATAQLIWFTLLTDANGAGPGAALARVVSCANCNEATFSKLPFDTTVRFLNGMWSSAIHGDKGVASFVTTGDGNGFYAVISMDQEVSRPPVVGEFITELQVSGLEFQLKKTEFVSGVPQSESDWETWHTGEAC